MANLNQGIYDLNLQKNSNDSITIYKKLKLGGSEVEAYKHIVTTLRLFFHEEITINKLEDSICDCTQDGQMDVIYVDKNKVYIFDIKRNSSFVGKDITAFLNSVEENIFKNNIDSKNLDKKIINNLKKIRSIKNREIYLIIFRNTTNNTPIKDTSFFYKYKSFKEVKFINVNDLIKRITEDKTKFPTLSIKSNTLASIDDNKSSKEEVFLKISIKDILKHKELGDKMNKDFFYKNVRNPKQDLGFKKELIATLAKYKSKFHLLHNGITIISDHISLDKGFYKIINPQIINGAQTIGLLHQIKKDNGFKFKDVYIFCKVLVVDSELAKIVCETANTQTPVNIWELRAHDSLHIKLEKYLSNYERKKTKNNIKNKIKLELFIQWVYAAFFKKPWMVKTGKKILFMNPTENTSVYNLIEQKLESCDVKEINGLVKSAFLVEDFIKKSSNKGFLRDIRFYLIAITYHKCFYNESDIKNVSEFLLKVSNKLKKKTKMNLTNNKIFNQSGNSIWLELEKKYAIK